MKRAPAGALFYSGFTRRGTSLASRRQLLVLRREAGVESLAFRRHVAQQRVGAEALAVLLGKAVAFLDEFLHAHLQVHEGADPSRVRREAPGEDGADVGVARVGDDAFLETAGDLDALAIEEAFRQLLLQRRRAFAHLHLDLLAEIGIEARGLALLVVVVEALARLAADALLVLDDP